MGIYSWKCPQGPREHTHPFRTQNSGGLLASFVATLMLVEGGRLAISQPRENAIEQHIGGEIKPGQNHFKQWFDCEKM